MPFAPGPDKARYRWYSCIIGDHIIPTNVSRGSVVVKAKSKAKKDAKKGAGKNKSSSTDQGKEDVELEIEWEFTAEDWEDGPDGPGVETVLEYIDPNGPRRGGPFQFSHPESDRRGVTSVEVTELESVVWKGHHGGAKFKAKEWTEPQADGNAGAGGAATTTPTNPDNWKLGKAQGKPPAPWSGAGNTSGPKAPLDAKQAPNAKP